MTPLLLLSLALAADPTPKLNVLFLGDSGHHQPAARFKQLDAAFKARGIALTYTDKLADLNPETLGKYDGLIVYANHGKFDTAEQEKALIDFVAGGKGFIPLHCASACFTGSKDYIALVGGQFRSHTTGTFRPQVVADHPITKGFSSFASWDETYVHTKHNETDRIVLEVRTDGDVKEPWTWVRTQGKGRVFYTAWGHDQRTWGHPGFHNLLERGVRWACGGDPSTAGVYVDAPKMTAIAGEKSDFSYNPAKIPFYPGKGQADPVTKMQQPLSPEKSMRHYSVPEGFELQLFAADKDFGGKPIAMTWDERGRLWVSVTVDYPNELKKDGEGRDKIVICEDTDGDGRADTFTDFADKLSIPTSLLNYAGGVIVHAAPDTLFLKDTDGDGKADVRQVLFTGWGTHDTHAGPSHLRYGFDNWVYGSVGYSGFNGTVNGEKVSFARGYYRMKVEPAAKPTADTLLSVTKLEFLRSTSNNTWGFGFSEDGQMFGSTANGCPLVHLPIPNRYYEKVRGLTPGVLPMITPDNHIEPITDKVRQVDFHGGFTAAAGCTIYTARTYPPEYWNKVAFVTEPTGHLAAALPLTPNGATYTARYGWNLVASDDEWAAPIDTTVGPDGHVWVLDWYNFIVQHNPTPAGFKNGKGNAYETELRDKTHGRVYRVVYAKAKPEKPFTLKDATPEKLVETLSHPNMGWRMHAQRLLVERGKADVVETLAKLSTGESAPATTHALWTMSGLGAFRGGPKKSAREALTAGLTNPSAGVRKAAIEAGSPLVLLIPETEKLFTDPDPQVRLAALLAASGFAAIPDSELPGLLPFSPAKPVVKAVFDPATWADRALADATTIAAAANPAEFLDVLVFEKYPEGTALDPRAAALVEAVAKQYAATYAPADEEMGINRLLGPLSLKDKTFLREPVVNGLAAGWVTGKKVKLDHGKGGFNRLVKELPVGPKARLLRLGSMWGVEGLDGQLDALIEESLTVAVDPKASTAARLAAARQVIDFRPDNDPAASKLLSAVSAESPPEFVVGLFEVLGLSKAKAVGPAVVAKLKDFPPTTRPAAMRLVLARPDATKAFLDAVEAGTLRFDVLALDQKTALAAHPDKTIAARAKKLLAQGGGLPDANRQKVIDELHPILAKTGDAPNGKKLFTQHCAKCHKHGAEGQAIGPDLTGMAVHPKEELLIHIIDPSRSVEGNFRAYTAKLLDGRVITGMLASESKTGVELLDAENKKHAISRDDIEELKESVKSLMPEGFEKQMKPEELGDLLEFLTQKGKFVPIPLDKVATVVSTKGMFFDESSEVERLVFKDWTPKEFAGVPFALVDPKGDRAKNVILLHGPNGKLPPTMPKSVAVPYNAPAKAIHLLGGVGGWSATKAYNGPVSMTVRLTYADGKTEDHDLKDGVHFADYIRRVDVPGSQFAFAVRGQQVRYLSVAPKRTEAIKQIEFVKGKDDSAPIVVAVTVESP